MTRKYYIPNMVQAITVLTVLKMLTNAQTTCNQGIGRVVYERLPDQQLQGYDDDVVRDTAPPFRVLEKCQELCLRDRTAQNNLVRTCTSFDFQPGSRIASFSGVVEYEESSCYLTREQPAPEGIGTLVFVPNSVHYTEVCLSSSRIERECPNRHYVFERHARKKLKLALADAKEVIAVNRTDCEDRCLNEFTFVCRSATYDTQARTCTLSRFTRRSHPELLEDDLTSDYLENTCLNAERRCDGPLIFVKEENKRLGGPFEVDIYTNISLVECQAQCLKAEKYFCRAVEYDEPIRRCIIFEEDSMSQKDDLRVSSSPTHDLYDLVCLDVKSNEFPDNSATSHLFAEGRRPDTAFERHRNARLSSEFHSEITGRSLSECLDECLRQVSFQCRSAVYSERSRICRLSRFNRRDGHRTIYDPDYDYYENLMHGGGTTGSYPRPDPQGQDSQYYGHGRPPYAPLSKPSGFGGVYSGGGYPSYVGSGGQIPAQPYAPPGDVAGPGYWSHFGTHSTDVSPYGVSPGSSSAYPIGSITPAPSVGVGYPPGGAPPAYGGSVPPIGGSSLGVSPGYPSYPPSLGGAPGGGGYFGGGGGGGGGLEPHRPFNVRCDEGDGFKQIGVHMRMRRQFVRRSSSVASLTACEKECAESRDFLCRSFNYRAAPYGPQRENCELSDRDTRDLDMNNPNYFDPAGEYDFYERSAQGRNGQDCLDVSQTCNEDGMEFTLRTPEGFLGRIYAHGYYDRCFYRGNGGTLNVLRISGAQGYPDCGTIRFGDMMTNIVVVQFSDYVQTSRDKRYNLTCLFRGPGEAVVTSSYMTANSGSPVPIEYLPAENSLSSRVRLMILYQGRPTNTIAVGDPLTFRLEAQDGYNYVNDIFASNVVARDPYSGRAVQLIDRYGCPVDNAIFPALDRSREGDGLEARFNAFKLPESNFLIFEATVKTCREGCNPAYCTGPAGRTEQSLGRRKREADGNEDAGYFIGPESTNSTDEEEHIREMIEVHEDPFEIPERKEESMQHLVKQQEVPTVCLTNREYYGMIFILFIFMGLMITVTITAGIYYKRYWIIMSKNEMANRSSGVISSPHSIRMSSTSPHTRFTPSAQSLFSFLTLNSQRTLNNSRSSECIVENKPEELQIPGVTDVNGCGGRSFRDISEPIYTDPSLFERSIDKIS
ncbi:uncharacterized protein LOC135845021 isoform X2 [Planococcus citri]|uniref:uncharacterized protein LOC135845021 isoform X2 n=1 Tax=Planococcus citri TaxID=170843 RepID=UPI0031F7F4A3